MSLIDCPRCLGRYVDPSPVELRWFLTEAEGALGLASNWEAAVNAASEARWVAWIWARLHRSHRRTLAAVYGPGLTPEAQARWGWLDDGDRTAALLLVTAEREGVGRRTLCALVKP